MSAIWALLNFGIHKNNMGERAAWMMSAIFGILFCLMYIGIIVYLYVVVRVWSLTSTSYLLPTRTANNRYRKMSGAASPTTSRLAGTQTS